MPEIWKDIHKYEGYYQVSNFGRVKSLKRKSMGRRVKERIMKSSSRSRTNPYLTVNLSVEGAVKKFSIHVLVAEAFIGARPLGLQVDHIDYNPLNNHWSNLQYVSQRTNLSKDRSGRSKFTGVFPKNKSFKHMRWECMANFNGKLVSIGLFHKEEEASIGYQLAISDGIEEAKKYRLERKLYWKSKK